MVLGGRSGGAFIEEVPAVPRNSYDLGGAWANLREVLHPRSVQKAAQEAERQQQQGGKKDGGAGGGSKAKVS